MFTVYLYDAITKEFSGTYAAQESPLEPGVFITPDHSTSSVPPANPVGNYLHFTGTVWETKLDTRGAWFKPSGEEVDVADLTTVIEATWTRTAPPPIFSFLKGLKRQAIQYSCGAFIIAGFQSNALGTVRHYPSNDKDQVNLSGSILRSTLPGAPTGASYPFLCENDTVWGYELHTAAQLQQVGIDSYNFILTARQKNGMLQMQITNALTQADLDAIVW